VHPPSILAHIHAYIHIYIYTPVSDRSSLSPCKEFLAEEGQEEKEVFNKLSISCCYKKRITRHRAAPARRRRRRRRMHPTDLVSTGVYSQEYLPKRSWSLSQPIEELNHLFKVKLV
jgi:hypothetical protein